MAVSASLRCDAHGRCVPEAVLSICSKFPAKLSPGFAQEPLSLHIELALADCRNATESRSESHY